MNDCKEALRRLKDGILPQANYVDILLIGEIYQLRIRRVFQPSTAPRFICKLHNINPGIRISIQYLRGNTLIFQTYLSILLAGTFLVFYVLLPTEPNIITLIATFCTVIVALIGIFIRENILISRIQEEMLAKIVEAVEFNQKFNGERLVKGTEGNLEQ